MALFLCDTRIRIYCSRYDKCIRVSQSKPSNNIWISPQSQNVWSPLPSQKCYRIAMVRIFAFVLAPLLLILFIGLFYFRFTFVVLQRVNLHNLYMPIMFSRHLFHSTPPPPPPTLICWSVSIDSAVTATKTPMNIKFYTFNSGSGFIREMVLLRWH